MSTSEADPERRSEAVDHSSQVHGLALGRAVEHADHLGQVDLFEAGLAPPAEERLTGERLCLYAGLLREMMAQILDLQRVSDSTVRFSVYDFDISDEDDYTDTTTVPFQVALPRA